ncbi:hypothetical protein [Nonomuraea pusilla]|uniref:Uncharacterized protein n=1 Tax=Nonomuraea pusilla TaxID=46177 RepID=A0A1H7FQD7_9ACTN|nr:hypothetical protein [Nonomuraea pusilla]SEK26370.1 hypothetical protein SAMN05660976_00116 [Nonomuraea pusilla]
MSQQPYGPPQQSHPHTPPRLGPVIRLAVVVDLAIAVSSVLDLVSVTQWQALRGDVEELTTGEATDRLAQLGALGWATTLLNWGTIGIWIVLLLRMRANIELRTPGRLQWKKETLVAVFVAPIALELASFVLPVLFLPATLFGLVTHILLIVMVNEIWRLGHPRRPGPASVLVIVWGVVGILDELFFTMASRWLAWEMLDLSFDIEASGDRATVGTDLIPVSNAMSVAYVLDAFFGVVAILMVWRLTAKHDEGLRTP